MSIWTRSRVLHGPAAAAYYNSAMMGEGLPNKGYDISDFQHNLGEALGVIGKALSLQVTGGSTSMKDGFERMRQAGASARETLKQAAADRLGVDRSKLKTASGHVIAPNGDAAFPIPNWPLTLPSLSRSTRPVKLRDPSEWRYLGQPQPRLGHGRGKGDRHGPSSASTFACPA